MFCSNCGYQMEPGASFCSNCGEKVMAAKMPEQSMGEAAANIPDISTGEEYTIRKGMCNWVKAALVVQSGHGVLTNKRFVYKLGKLGSLDSRIYNAVSGSKNSFEIPLSELVGIREGHQGLARALTLQTRSGEEYKCTFMDTDGWLMEFNKLLKF